MLKIAVVDDEPIFCERVSRKIYSVYGRMNLAVQVDCYTKGKEVLYEVDDGRYYAVSYTHLTLPTIA